MRLLFYNIFQSIFNRTPSHLLLFDLISLFSRFKKVEKELERLQAELCLVNQQHEIQHLKNVESRIYNIMQYMNEEKLLFNKQIETTSNSNSEQKNIDPLIKPICKLLLENGYFTFASCSGHVSVTKIAPNDYWKKENWYLLFTTKNDLKWFKKVMQELELEGVKLKLLPFKKEDGDFPFPVYRLSASLRECIGKYNDQTLYEFNKKIYCKFKFHLEEQELVEEIYPY